MILNIELTKNDTSTIHQITVELDDLTFDERTDVLQAAIDALDIDYDFYIIMGEA